MQLSKNNSASTIILITISTAKTLYLATVKNYSVHQYFHLIETEK